MPLLLFAFLAALAVISGLGVILQRSPIHCVLALALTLVDIGALFIGQGTDQIHGSMMTGKERYAILGGVLLVIGLAFVISALRSRRRRL